MSYEYDVFISYARGQQPNSGWGPWVHGPFRELLDFWLDAEVPGIRICTDKDLEVGASWPQDLARKLASSKLLVPLLSRQYFYSAWCLEELGQMLAREAQCGFRTIHKPAGLILPIIIHDGEEIPPDVSAIQALIIKDYVTPWFVKQSVEGMALSGKVRDWAPNVRSALDRAPPFDKCWLQLAGLSFSARYRQVQQKQRLMGLG